MTKIEVGKTYQTRDGSTARIIATDAKGDWPVVALVPADANANREYTIMLDANGVYYANHNCDLIIPTERKSYWVNLYPNGNYGHVRREDADRIAGGLRTHVLEIKTEDGEPVEVKLHKVAK